MYMTNVFFLGRLDSPDFVDVHNDEAVQEHSQDLIYETLENKRCIH